MNFKKCSKCQQIKDITEFPIDKCKKDGHRYTCKECEKIRWKNYYKRNTELRRLKNKKDYQNNKPQIIETVKRYAKTENGKKLRQRVVTRRKQTLGYRPINKHFKNSHKHHLCINGFYDLCIYIPAELHYSIRHNSVTGDGMREINKAALLWLCEQDVI